MKVTAHVDGGPLDGSYTFDNYDPANLNNTGFALGSNEQAVWMLVDMPYCSKDKIGYVQSGMSPASLQRRLAGEKDFKPGPCNYWVTEWEQENGEVVARFRHIEFSEGKRFQAVRSVQAMLEKLKTKIASDDEAAPGKDLIKTVVAIIEMQQRQINLLDPSPLIALWTRPKQ